MKGNSKGNSSHIHCEMCDISSLILFVCDSVTDCDFQTNLCSHFIFLTLSYILLKLNCINFKTLITFKTFITYHYYNANFVRCNRTENKYTQNFIISNFCFVLFKQLSNESMSTQAELANT